jgi:HEAT repeat protein
LIAAYRVKPSWQLGDAIARTMTPAEHDVVVELAADRGAGTDRQMLVDALWRVKSERARTVIYGLLDDPDVSRHAIHSLRRIANTDEAVSRLEPLTRHLNRIVRESARDALKRIERARSKHG